MARNKKETKRPTGRRISQEQIRKQGSMIVLSVLSNDSKDIIDQEFSFAMENRILPTNVNRKNIVRCEVKIEKLTQKRSLLVVKKMLVEPPSSTLKELYNSKGVDAYKERNILAQNDPAEISLNEHFLNSGADSILAKNLYSQEIAALCQLFEKSGINYDVEVAEKVQQFFQRRAKVRGFESVYEMVTDNPYVLTDLDDFSMRTMAKSAPLINKDISSKTITYSFLSNWVWHFTRQGHSYAPLNLVAYYLKNFLLENNISQKQHHYYLTQLAYDLPNNSSSKLVPFSQYEEEAHDYYLDVYTGKTEKPEMKARNAKKGVYLASAFYAERNAAKDLAGFIEKHTFPNFKMSQKDIEGLDEQQIKAVNKALTNRLSIVNGHAGGGKTHFIAKMVKIINDNGLKAVVLAPAAIAAAHVAEKIAEKTSEPIEYGTIHRLAKILSFDDDYGENANSIQINNEDAIVADVVIVDEIKMCNICTFSHLLHAIKNNQNTHLVLVGDTAQLPAIGPSGFFEQLVNMGSKLGIPVTTFKKQYRNNDDIFILANMILQGVFPNELIQKSPKINLGTIEDIQDIAVHLKDKGVNIKDVLFLSPVILDRQYGTKKLNSLLKKVYNPQGVAIKGTAFCVGDPVIANKNDQPSKNKLPAKENFMFKKRHPERNRNVYNGMRGIIVAYNGETVTVEYPDPDQAGTLFQALYTPEELPSWLDLAYAITVHKAEGQEAPYIIFVNGNDRLTRNMFYTAVTRGKQGVYLLGQEEAFCNAVNNPCDEPLSKFIFMLQDELLSISRAKEEPVDDGWETVFG